MTRTLIAVGKVKRGKVTIQPLYQRVDMTLAGLCPLCGYVGKLRNGGWVGYHCPACGAKVLCQDNRWE